MHILPRHLLVEIQNGAPNAWKEMVKQTIEKTAVTKKNRTKIHILSQKVGANGADVVLQMRLGNYEQLPEFRSEKIRQAWLRGNPSYGTGKRGVYKIKPEMFRQQTQHLLAYAGSQEVKDLFAKLDMFPAEKEHIHPAVRELLRFSLIEC